ncbi:MAG: hypothetical protein HQL69_01805 [Magnetococcales bacterium]|nr:hypothetical protein [Magnetococcales bacterium]
MGSNAVERNRRTNSSAFMIKNLQRVGKAALIVSLILSVCIILAIYYLEGNQGENYIDVLRSLALTRSQLKPVLLMSGLVLVILTGVVTWLIAQYSTKRVTGILHHFTICLQKQVQDGPTPFKNQMPSDIRMDEHARLVGGVHRLQFHYDAMSELVDLAEVQLELSKPDLGGGLTKTIKQLRELDASVKL